MNKENSFDLVIQNGSLAHGARSFHAHICIKNGKIAQIMQASLPVPYTKEIYDASGKFIFPGFIDPHVHFELDLNGYKSADDFYTGSVAAAFGGVTTVFDFTDVVTGGEEDLNEKVMARKIEASKAINNVQLHLTIAEPDIDPYILVELAIRNKIKSIKAFTTYSSTDRMTSDGYIMDLLKASRGTNLTVMVHAENDGIIRYKTESYRRRNVDGKIPSSALPELHPTISETEAALRVSQMAVETGGKIYLAHISSGNTILELKKHFSEYLGKNIFVESCPHYFYLNDAFLRGENSALYTVCPPLRKEEERLKLREMLSLGLVNAIGTDHCPFRKEVKERFANDYLNMPNGLPGVELSFSLMYNLMMLEQNPLTMEQLTDLFSTTPAKIFGLYPFKGSLTPGADADITIFDPDTIWKVDPESLKMNVDYTPYDGLKLRGKVDSTVVNGKFVLKNKELVEENGSIQENN